MANLVIGCDFRAQHLVAIRDLVRRQDSLKTPHRITGVYGNMRGAANPFRSVRPKHREASGHQSEFTDSIKFLKDIGLEVSVTMNSMFPHLQGNIQHNIFDDHASRSVFFGFIERMNSIVDYWIVAHPFVVELMHSMKLSPAPKLILSTIMNMSYVSQFKWVADHWPQVKRVCPSIYRNRDIGWLRKANSILPLELLVNEFCCLSGVPCEGLYRQACYHGQSLGIQNWNPMETCCIASRENPESSWISARFILPQWVEGYKFASGVQHYKITGRTHGHEFVKYIGEVYCDGNATGDLRKLWGQLQATMPKVNQKEEHHKALKIGRDIPMELLDSYRAKLVLCDLDRCRVDCFKCENIYKEITADVPDRK